MPDDQPVACVHEHLAFHVYDQTGGVACADCGERLAMCWDDQHIPESLWNRLAAQDKQCERCKRSRDNVCAICEKRIQPPKPELSAASALEAPADIMDQGVTSSSVGHAFVGALVVSTQLARDRMYGK